MISKSLVEMIKGRWREFCREPSALVFVVLVPLVWMVVLGFAFSQRVDPIVPIGVYESSDVPQSLIKAFEKNTRIKVINDSKVALDTKLKRREIHLILSSKDRSLTFNFDPTFPDAQISKYYIENFIQKNQGRVDKIATLESPVNTIGSRYVDFLIPGLLALSLLTTSLFGTGMTIVANRREKLLKRYVATPMNPYNYILSHIIGRFFIFLVEFVSVSLAGILIFGFTNQGSWVDYSLFALFATAVLTALGILCSSRTTNGAAYNGMVNLLALPMMFLSGVWFSRNGFPEVFAEAVRYLPLTPIVDGLRKISLEGLSILDLKFEMMVLTGYLVVSVVAAKKAFKWY